MTLAALMTVIPITTSPEDGHVAYLPIPAMYWMAIGFLIGVLLTLAVFARFEARKGRRDEIERNARMNAFASHLRQRRLQRALRPDVKRTARG